MFAHISTVALFALAASASVLPRGGGNQCNTGELHCCNQLQAADSSQITGIAALLGVAVNALSGQAAINCSPLTVIGLESNSCTAQPVCCTDNHFNGLLVVGCTPINANL